MLETAVAPVQGIGGFFAVFSGIPDAPEGHNDSSPAFPTPGNVDLYCARAEGTVDSLPVSYISAYFHCVFSTKERRPFITEDLRERLWPFLGGIARQNKIKAVAIGGVADHVHLLLSVPAVLSIAKAMQLIKGGSSKWVHETFPEQRQFGWQKKYGAFSVSVSQLDAVIRYIEGQKEHHRKLSFQE